MAIAARRYEVLFPYVHQQGTRCRALSEGGEAIYIHLQASGGESMLSI